MDIGTYKIQTQLQVQVQVQVQVEVQVEVIAARSRLSCLQNQIQNTKQQFSQQVACVKGAVTIEKHFLSFSLLLLPPLALSLKTQRSRPSG